MLLKASLIDRVVRCDDSSVECQDLFQVIDRGLTLDFTLAVVTQCRASEDMYIELCMVVVDSCANFVWVASGEDGLTIEL